MVENMFFLDSEHIGMGGSARPEKSYLSVFVECLVSKNYFTWWFFFVAAIIRYGY